MIVLLKYPPVVLLFLCFVGEMAAQPVCATADHDTLLTVLFSLRKTDSLYARFQDSVQQVFKRKEAMLSDSIDQLNQVHDRVFSDEETRQRREQFLRLHKQLTEMEPAYTEVIERRRRAEIEKLEKESRFFFEKTASELGFACLMETDEVPVGITMTDITGRTIQNMQAAYR